VSAETAGGRASAWLRRPLVLVALAIGAALWLLAAHRLWHTTVPSGLALSHENPRASFSAAFLARSASYERFLAIDALLAAVALVGVLALYARHGARLMRESAAGPIGTGMMLGMLGLGIVWIAEVPFGVAGVWWERRHGVSHQGYVQALLESFLGLGGTFLAISFALLITMFLARVLRGWWWLAAAPFFVGLALLTAYLSAYLIPQTHPLHRAALIADARALARTEQVPDTQVEVQDVARYTTAPNAEAVGFGATRRVILWDTLLDGRFSRREIRAVLAHELGHIAHGHILKGVGWLALFLLPVAALIAVATRRRGGLARPEAVPVALFVLVTLSVLTQPLQNVAVRRIEAEADWAALQATRDPAAARALFRRLATTSLSDPDPPTWSYVLNESHPTIAQRIAMTRAWQERH
jgi:STE24 endopeptidase